MMYGKQWITLPWVFSLITLLDYLPDIPSQSLTHQITLYLTGKRKTN